MYEYGDELIFEESWQSMLTSYSVQDSTWLKKIYKVKEKWVKCYMKTAFTIGMRSTQLRESLNGDLKNYLKSSLDIVQFFKHFERVVNAKRYNKLQAEYQARQKLPRMKVKTSLILRQVAHVYTPSIFELFQEEWERSFEAYIKYRHESSTVIAIFVGQEGEYRVTTTQSDQTVSCSCRKFDQIGFLCCHALKVLDVMDVKSIPERYIMKRWSKEARNGCIQEVNRSDIQCKAKLDVTERYRDLCSELVKLATRASNYEEAYILVKNVCVELTKKVDFIVKEHITKTTESRVNSNTLGESVECNDSTNKIFQQVKGLKKRDGRKGGRRPKSWVEQQSKRKKPMKKKDAPVEDHRNYVRDEYQIHKEIEIPWSVAWMNYESEHNLRNSSTNSFIELLMGIGGSNSHHVAPLVATGQESLLFKDSDHGRTPLLPGNMSMGQTPPSLEGSLEKDTVGAGDVLEASNGRDKAAVTDVNEL